MTRTNTNRARGPDRMPERVRRRILREIRRAIRADLLLHPRMNGMCRRTLADGIPLILAISSALYLHLRVFGP